MTVLRAAVVIGHGGISWEITRQLVDHLPVMVTPRWVNTRTQPIALRDVVRYLVGVLEPAEARGSTYEIGGPDVLRYIDMLVRAAKVSGKTLPNLSVPMLTPRLSSRWLSLVTDVDIATARNLVDSMTNEVIVRDHSIEKLVPGANHRLRRRRSARPQGARGRARMRSWPARLERVVAPALIDKVPRDHAQPDSAFRRRRIVAAITLVVGAALLAVCLAIAPGDTLFYPLTLAVAATWTLGGFLSGPLHLGYFPWRGTLRRPVVTPILIGLVAAAVFVLGALVVREIGPLRDYVDNVLAHAREGSIVLVTIVTLANGAAEEVFFRGALFAAIGRRHPVLISTVIYALVTVATGNPMLVFAAVTLGAVLALQRRASGGILAPMLTHVTWSTVMLFALPPLFR